MRRTTRAPPAKSMWTNSKRSGGPKDLERTRVLLPATSDKAGDPVTSRKAGIGKGSRPLTEIDQCRHTALIGGPTFRRNHQSSRTSNTHGISKIQSFLPSRPGCHSRPMVRKERSPMMVPARWVGKTDDVQRLSVVAPGRRRSALFSSAALLAVATS